MGNTNLFFKKIIQFLLKWCAKIYLWRVKPKVIVIAGTTCRFWIKEAVKEILEEKNFLVRANKKKFNAEIGLPLSILNLSSGNGSFFGWLKILCQAIIKIITGYQLPIIDCLVLEMAIDAPENMNYLASIVKPDVAILTTVTMIYAENFENLDEISREYGELIKTLPWNGILILNNDDLRIRKLSECFNGKTITFGFSDDSQYKAINIHKIADGQKFEIICANQRVNLNKPASAIKINRFGKHHIYAELVKAVFRDNCKEPQKDFFGKIFSPKADQSLDGK